ncbi:MAG: hypothetical protein GX804_01295 [Lentisphaerae bacterium]|nr:hypothetical protein [Lentisphaerota bacterium]
MSNKKKYRRIPAILFAVVLCFWMLYHPRRMHSLFLAMPPEASVASYHRNIASEIKNAFRNKTIVPILINRGIYEEENIERKTATIRWISFWLTGSDTVVAYVPESIYSPENSEYLAAASYVGWKSEIMEVLWRIKRIPGLGKLSVTPSGTRYLAFEDFTNKNGEDLLLALDVVDGMLLATLSTNPETVRQLSDRVLRLGPNDNPAIAFQARHCWEELSDSPHTFWAYDPVLLKILSPVKAEISSLAKRDFVINVEISDFVTDILDMAKPFKAFTSPIKPCADIPSDAAAILVASDASLLRLLGRFSPPQADGVGVAYLSGKPYNGYITMLASPAVHVAADLESSADFPEWIEDVQEMASRSGVKMRFARGRSDSGSEAVYFIPSVLETLRKAGISEMAYALEDQTQLRAGTHYGSYEKQKKLFRLSPGSRSVADDVAEWQSLHPAAFGALRLNLPKVATEFRHVGGIAQILARFDGTEQSTEIADYATIAAEWLQALVPVGIVECVAVQDDDDVLCVRVNTSSGGI